jgi:hypothetical protein
LRADDRASYWKLSVELVGGLTRRERYAEAREVWTEIETMAGLPREGDGSNLLRNAGFEQRTLGELNADLAALPDQFDWVLRRHPEAPARRSGYERHGGGNALHLALPASMSAEFNHIAQLAAVTPGVRYRLRYFAKARHVSADPDRAPFVELADAAQPGRFSLRSVLPGGDSAWQEQEIAFTIPPETRGVHVRIRIPQIVRVDLARVMEVWFDDFRLERAEP